MSLRSGNDPSVPVGSGTFPVPDRDPLTVEAGKRPPLRDAGDAWLYKIADWIGDVDFTSTEMSASVIEAPSGREET